MYKFMQIEKFAKVIFDSEKAARKASKIIAGVLQAKSPRISDIADQMKGAEAANYKLTQRFLKQEDLQTALQRLFNEESEFVIGDPTEIERPGAKKTDYVGTLSDGQTKGFPEGHRDDVDAALGNAIERACTSLSLCNLLFSYDQ
jgi:DNA repair exonuclease SbcCD ATPase subunit